MSIEQGKFAEHIFASKCIENKIELLSPVVDVHGYDFVIKKNGAWLRIQVKSTSKADTRYPNKPSYKVQVRKGNKKTAYSSDDFDYCAVYIIPEKIFYIIPIEDLNKTTIRINCRSDKCKFHKYKENFSSLMKE